MPPKMEKEFKEFKDALEFLTAEMAAVRLEQKTIISLVEEVKTLRLQLNEKEKTIAQLENRVSDLEQYTRMNDIIVTGLAIKPRSFARAVAGLDETNQADSTSVEQQVTAFFLSKGIELDGRSIEACHPLPQRTSDKPTIILRFANRKHKTALLKQKKILRGSDVYLNEHLTKKNADIAKKARFLRKGRKIQSTWTANCKVYIKPNGAPENSRGLVVRSIEELDKYQ